MVRYSLLALCALPLAIQALASPPPQVALQPDEPVHTTAGWSYINCGMYDAVHLHLNSYCILPGTPDDVIQIESIQVTPDPPQPGKDLTVRVVGVASEIIQASSNPSFSLRRLLTRLMQEGAYADVTVKLGLVKLLRKRFDVCEEA